MSLTPSTPALPDHPPYQHQQRKPYYSFVALSVLDYIVRRYIELR